MRTGNNDVSLNIVDGFHYPYADIRQFIQHLLVMHDSPESLYPIALTGYLFQDIERSLHTGTEPGFSGFFNYWYHVLWHRLHDIPAVKVR